MIEGVIVFIVGVGMGAAGMHAWWATYYIDKLQDWRTRLKEIQATLERKNKLLAQHPPEPLPGEQFVIVRKRDWAERN